MRPAPEKLVRCAMTESSRVKLRYIAQHGGERRFWAVLARLIDAEYERLVAQREEATEARERTTETTR
jgi:hypothetical protein